MDQDHEGQKQRPAVAIGRSKTGEGKYGLNATRGHGSANRR